MRTLIIIFSVFIFSCGGQKKMSFEDSRIIFQDNYKPSFKIPNGFTITNLDEKEVLIAEKIFYANYHDDLDKENIAWYNSNENPQKKYKKYKRQYIGFIDALGNKVVLIQFLNFNKKRKARTYFDKWKEDFIIGFGDFYEKNTVRFLVNLNLKKVELR